MRESGGVAATAGPLVRRAAPWEGAGEEVEKNGCRKMGAKKETGRETLQKQYE